MEELIKQLEGLKLHHERTRGSQKIGLASSFWDGRARGVADAIAIIRESQPLENPERPAAGEP